MKKHILLVCIIFITLPLVVKSQSLPSTEIYVFDFKIWLDQYSISNPTNVSSNPGFYDNQPQFTPNGDSFLYTSADESGKTDIYLYDFIGNERRRITYTPEVSEYSPTIMPEKKAFSCVILEEDGTQKLWKYFIDAPVASLISEMGKVGYHAWINNDQLALFIIGNNNNTLHITNLDGTENKQIANKIGRDIYKIPGQNKVSYVSMETRKWMIMSYDLKTGVVEEIIDTLPDSQDYLWTPNGLILMGDGSKLYKFDPTRDKNWVELADLTSYGLKKFDRIAVNSQVSKLAVVVLE